MFERIATGTVWLAGASLTLRGSARKLTFITVHACAGEQLNLDWKSLSDADSTLAIYMGKAAAGAIATNLINAGLAPDTSALVVENCSLPNERITRSRLDLLQLATGAAVKDGPAVLIIGMAVVVLPPKVGVQVNVDGAKYLALTQT